MSEIGKETSSSPFLIKITKGLIIDACNGPQRNMFGSITEIAGKWHAEEKRVATQKTFVDLYKIEKSASLSQIFDNLSVDLNDICLNQDQISNFVKNHTNTLSFCDGVYFIFKSDNKFVAAFTSFFYDGVIGLDILDLKHTIYTEPNERRLVVPQLIA